VPRHGSSPDAHMRKVFIPLTTMIITGAVAAFCAALTPGPQAAAERHPVWSPAKWPFAMDQWGTGTAFSCKASDCGSDINLYLRPKIGFCNCTSGVADDEELERLADFGLFSNRQAALAPSRPIEVGWMKGRSRPYAFVGALRRQKSALTIAFSDRCDAIVATTVADSDHFAEIESLTLDFLNSDTVIHWAATTLGT
jgi:hypothetical protein